MGTNVVSSWEQIVRLLRNGTKEPASCADSSLYERVRTLLNKLKILPPPPRSVWKKLVQQQVPLHIATVLSTAAQHSAKSPGTNAALMALEGLLETATASALIKDNAAAGSLAVSMRQQLQEAGLLQQLAAVMVALAADLRSAAADITGMSQEQLRADLSCYTLNKRNLSCMACLHLSMLHRFLRDLWGSAGSDDSASSMLWLCDPSGYPEASMQLCTAGLQHASIVLQHVLPAVGVGQQASVLVGQKAAFTAVIELGHDMVTGVYNWKFHYDKLGGHNEQWRSSAAASVDAQAQQRLQQLLLSCHCAPFFASLVLLTVFWFSSSTCLPAASNKDSKSVAGSSSRSSSSTSSTSSTSRRETAGSSTKQRGRRAGERHAAYAAASSHRDGTRPEGEGDTFTPCQHKLFDLLGLSPQLIGIMEQTAMHHSGTGFDQRLWRTTAACLASTCCCDTFSELISSGGQQAGGDLQRWQFEQQLWLLLPSVVLPCAGKLWLPLAGTLKDAAQEHRDEANAMFMLLLCTNAQVAANNLQHCLGGSLAEYRLPHPAWMQEVLGGVLQLADQLLLQQPRQNHAPNSTTSHSQSSSNTPSSSSNTPSSSNSRLQKLNRQGSVAQVVQGLLSRSLQVFNSSAASPLRQLMSIGTHGSIAAGDVAVMPIPVVPDLAGGGALATLYNVIEAGLRLVTTAVQCGALQPPLPFLQECLQSILGIEGGSARSLLSLHLGLREPDVLTVEQRQLYSVLSTLQKLSYQAGASGELCWGIKMANRCCWDVGEEAVGLLQIAVLIAGSAAAEVAAPAAEAAAPAGSQQARAPSAAASLQELPEVEYLPSLVIFGRCCLVWAEQLRQQAPELLLLLASGAAAQQQQQGGLQAKHSAAWVCIPKAASGVQEGAAAASTQSYGLERLVATVLSWVGSITSPAAHTALAAAAGGDPQQVRQQLEALSAAQAAVRQEGVSDVSFAALVQQLQATGVMLSSIAVPQFCNNPACVNIDGPTEVQLVSGRSCICAGCRTARYCGRACQRQVWRQHKPVCKALAAAAAAASTQG